MREWHIKQNGRWVTVQSKNCPTGPMAHLVSETCGNWPCGQGSKPDKR